MKTLLVAALLLIAAPAYSQTFCQRLVNSFVCDGENGSRAIQPLGRNGAIITDERGNNSYYSNGMILESESRSYRDAQRRSEERRREMIYGDDRRERNRSRYDDER
jgi:hypothetical protein